MSKSFEELISKANQKTLKKVSVSNAQDEPVLQAVKAANSQSPLRVFLQLNYFYMAGVIRERWVIWATRRTPLKIS